ncbi:toll-like receptor 4 [Mercenaria mercenaria]|uniref:toll-like receptor 4 n=1 Tax=Mercenaria mercenaria TaxID=6596 RepID=UPI001E1D7D11|nr:toll-like receptor 4 [Mercenaria mercenaria]
MPLLKKLIKSQFNILKKDLRVTCANKAAYEEGAVVLLHRLELLEISSNTNLTFDSITKGLRQLNSPNLQVFNISGNHNTEDLPGAFIRKPMFELLSNTSLKILDVSWTKLTTLLAPFDLIPHLETLNISGRHIAINLKDNALECDCQLTEDVNVSTTPFSCSFEGENILISKNIAHAFVQNVCAEEDERNLMTLLGAMCGVLGAVALLIVAVVIYRKRKHSAVKDTDQQNIPVIIHLKDCESMEEYPHRNPKFVVFLAYCSKDSEFVLKKIYRKLNNKLLKLLEDTEYVKDPDHLIILYDKHFLAGVDIDEICRKAITESHVTVAVVTENFLESSWCN